MKTLEISLDHALIKSINTRMELHGDENHLAMDVDLEVDVARTVVAEKIIGNKKAFEQLSPRDTFSQLNLIAEYEGHTIHITDLVEDIQLFGCKVKKFVCKPAGDSLTLSCQGQKSKVDDSEMTALAHLIRSHVTVAIAPEGGVAAEQVTPDHSDALTPDAA